MEGPPHVRLSLKKGMLYHGEILHHLHTGIASGVKFSHGSTTLLKSVTSLKISPYIGSTLPINDARFYSLEQEELEQEELT